MKRGRTSRRWQPDPRRVLIDFAGSIRYPASGRALPDRVAMPQTFGAKIPSIRAYEFTRSHCSCSLFYVHNNVQRAQLLSEA